MDHHITGLEALAVDCAEPKTVAAFWQRLLGGETTADDDDFVELRGGMLPLDFIRVPEPKSVKNRLHLDLRSADAAASIEFALGLGAALADDVYDGGDWQVMRDPEGNEFCFVGGRD